MNNLQLVRLNQTLLKNLKEDDSYIAFEPLSVSRKKLYEIEAGDWIDLGKKEPKLYIKRGDSYIKRVRFLKQNNKYITFFLDEEVDISLKKIKKKKSILDIRVAKVSKDNGILEFFWNPMETLLIFNEENTPLAEGKLIEYDGGYAIEIEEIF